MAAHTVPCDVIKQVIANERVISAKETHFNELIDVSYENFFQNHLIPNRPCLFGPKSTEMWASRCEWVCEFDGSPNFGFFEKLGDCVVPVANCKEEQFFSHPKQDLTLKEYIKYWREYKDDGYPDTESCLYLKDWHLTKAFPNYKAYTTPVYFQSDWLNEFWDTEPGGDDYRFVYMGPKGTWTSFHADVYRSYSWSANICGRKLWIFFPPGQEEQFRDRFGNLAYDVTSPELEDKVKYPHYSRENDKRIEIVQEQGQIIFVPSGWHHQVYNLEDTISINHNWLNGCNIDICWQHLKDNLDSVKREIADCKEMDGWHEQCQLILKASAGIDYKMFYKLLQTIAENRIKQLQLTNCSECCDSSSEAKSWVSDTNQEGDISHKNTGSDPRLDVESRDSDAHNNAESNARIYNNSGNDSRHKSGKDSIPKMEDNSSVSNVKENHTKISLPLASYSQNSVSQCASEDKVDFTNVSVCPQKSLSPTHKDLYSGDLTGTNRDKTDSEEFGEITLKCTFDKTEEATEMLCQDVEHVVKTDDTKTWNVFRKLKLYPKRPDDHDHTIFDLLRLEYVLKEVLNDDDFKTISTDEDLVLARQLLDRIQSSVKI